MTLSNLDIAEVGALVGDPARANMLAALMDGRALTAGELAAVARVSPQTASGHLAKLAAANLLALERQGRHRYYRLASPLVGQMLETIMAVAAIHMPPRHRPLSRIDAEMRRARSCYDHLAGQLGVGLAEALSGRGHVALSAEGGEVTAAGMAFLDGFGVELAPPKPSRRALCRACLDWSERRWHIGGLLGAGLLHRCLDLGWLARRQDSRALTITPAGSQGFAEVFGIDPV